MCLYQLAKMCPYQLAKMCLYQLAKMCLYEFAKVSVSFSKKLRWPSGKIFALHVGGRGMGPRHRHFFFNLMVLLFFFSNHLFTLFYLSVFLSGVGVLVPGCVL